VSKSKTTTTVVIILKAGSHQSKSRALRSTTEHLVGAVSGKLALEHSNLLLLGADGVLSLLDVVLLGCLRQKGVCVRDFSKGRKEARNGE
jgi:hypothetical protein